jgi:pimeloyl-ACP methyl ester carboxylesterase
MFKRTLILLLVCLLWISLVSGCAGKRADEDNIEDSEAAKIKAISIQYAEEMAAGNFDGTVSAFDEVMSASLSQEQLKQAWSETVKNIGAYRSVLSAEYEDMKSGCQVAVMLEYEKSGLRVLFSYDLSGKIIGLWLSYSDLPKPSGELLTDIAIHIGEEPYMLDGIMLLPEGTKNPPVAIFVQGSGQSDYDETIGANKPFKDLADGLCKQGIASVRYNKRYYQYPETAPADITVEDEILNDVGYAIKFVKAQESLKDSRIYILGHSQGGMLAPYIASMHPEVSGIILMAGSPRSLEDIILDQNAAAIEAMEDKSDAEKERMLKNVQDEVDRIKALASDELGAPILGIPVSYWLSLKRIDTVKISQSLTIPMLILQGGQDFQVSPEKDFKLWKDVLNGKENVAFRLYDGLNHLFMPSNGKKDISEYNIKSNVDKQVTEDISGWILELERLYSD